MGEKDARRWTCDERDGQGNCRNAHGCHCAEITSLIAEREGLEREVARQDRKLTDEQIRVSALLRAQAAAEAQLSALQEACKPFADLASYFEASTSPMPDSIHLNHRMTLGDCRRVRALLPTVPVEES